jgi:hypothetical protein
MERTVNHRKAMLIALSIVIIWPAPIMTQQAFREDMPLNPDYVFQANVLMVKPPTDPGEFSAYTDFLAVVETVYDITIQKHSLNPNELGSSVIEKHFWENRDLGRRTTAEIRDMYTDAGYTAYLSEIIPTHQLGIGEISKILYGELPPPPFKTDPLMTYQIPYPFGEDDMYGFPDNEGGYLRARYSLWPPDAGAQETVLLVLSDTGCWWRYSDFMANLWQNPGEDLDGDGVIVDLGEGEYDFDPKDLDGADSDGNGYNDLIGYDFIAGREDPTNYSYEFFSHGTSVYSVIGSETYNGQHMAGLLFPGYVKVVPTKVGENFGIYEAEAVEGIYYAAYLVAQGYKVVVNMSWGGAQHSEPLEEALGVLEALGGGAVASVGNDNNGAERYPAAFSSVLAITATTSENIRAPFSNFGSWCDIAAPGQDILGALWIPSLPVFQIDYLLLGGTSFAAPFVAGTAAMLWSTQSQLTWSEVKDALFEGLYTPEDYPWDPPGSWPNDTYIIGEDPPNDGVPYYGEGILDAKLVMDQFR